MPEIHHEIKIAAAPERVFAALTTLDGVQGWHTPTATGSGVVGSEWAFSFADHPDFGWEVTASDAPSTVVWLCTRGPGDSVSTTATFTLTTTDDDRTLVAHLHAGWPGTHRNFR